jgi:hypothetical protein
MKIITMAAVVAATTLGVTAAPAIAAPASGPTGSIDVASAGVAARTAGASTGLQYDGTVAFDTSVEGKISSKARVYVTVVCWQGDQIIFQYSADPDFAFPLTDQAGQGLEWNGGDADCEAWLLYRVEKGRSAEITMLDMVEFHVAGNTA